MKKGLFTILSISALIFFYSCDDKACDNVICGTNSTCVSGACFCADGYEGSNCDVVAAQKYQGSYIVSSACYEGNAIGQHTVFVSSDPGQLNKIIISNFLNLGLSTEALIFTNTNNEGNVVQIPEQNVGATRVAGSGEFNPNLNRIVMDVTHDKGGVFGACTVTMFKQ